MKDLLMPDIFEYTDYQEYLKDYYAYRKALHPSFSWRAFAQKINLDAGFLVRVAQGKANIPVKHVPTMAGYLKLNNAQGEYLGALVTFARARTPAEVRDTFEHVLSLQKDSVRILQRDQYAYFNDWYHGAIRAFLTVESFYGDYEKLAASLVPAITPQQARSSIELLIRLGLLTCLDTGEYVVTDRHVSTGEKWKSQALRKYQKDCIQLGQQSIERFAPEHRDVSTLTLAIAQEDVPELRELAADFRQKALQVGKNRSHTDCVYQMNIQIFPIGATPAVCQSFAVSPLPDDAACEVPS
jgi:uncharacterized protein (TIGR02147 family)